jgi:hypothetical protein
MDSTKTLVITQPVATWLKYYTAGVPGEVSGMGKSHFDKEKNQIVMTDIILFKQKCTSATTDLSDAQMGQFNYQLVRDGKNPAEWNVWWHTHGNFSVFWSGKDNETIAGHLEAGHLVSLVTNKAGDFKARLDVFLQDSSPYGKRHTITEDLPVVIGYDDTASAEVNEQVKVLLKEKEEAEKFLGDVIKETNDKIMALRGALLNSPEIEALANDEIKEKVEVPPPVVYNRCGYYVGSGGYHGYNSGQQTSLYSYPGKKKARKGKNYYDGSLDYQNEFEETLEEIVTSGNAPAIYDDYDDVGDYRFGVDDDYDESPAYKYEEQRWCNECQNPIELCDCDLKSTDSMDKMESINHYLGRQQRIHSVEDYTEEERAAMIDRIIYQSK